MRFFSQCARASSVAVSSFLFVVVVLVSNVTSSNSSLHDKHVSPAGNTTDLPSLLPLRPSHNQKNALLRRILGRLCKYYKNSLCLQQTSNYVSAVLDSHPRVNKTLTQTEKPSKGNDDVSRGRTVFHNIIGNTSISPRTRFLHEGPFLSFILPPTRKRAHFRYNKKVFVYGEDDRSAVPASRMRRYPYSNVVRLSSGCTGTLLTPLHVLTAAHCVHNGLVFRNNLQMLKIEVPHTMGFRVYYIEKISIPIPWLKRRSMGETARSSYDYAIVKLNFAVAGRRRFMPLSVPKANILNEDTYFLAFKSLNDPKLWSSECHSRSNMRLMEGHLLLTRCDSSVGNSGAAVFTDSPREGKKIIGIISNTRSVARFSFVMRYSIITALTWGKLFEVCSMMSPYGRRYGVCPSFHYMPLDKNEPIDNRILPYFG